VTERFAFGELRHGRGHAGDRAHDAASDEEGEETAEEQAEPGERGLHQRRLGDGLVGRALGRLHVCIERLLDLAAARLEPMQRVEQLLVIEPVGLDHLVGDLVEDLGVGVERGLHRRQRAVEFARRRELGQRFQGKRRFARR